MYGKHTASDIAKRLGRTAEAVKHRAFVLGLTENNYWSKKEFELLKRLYPKSTAQDIADKIGRPVGSVRLKVFKLGLKKRKSKAE